MNHQFLLKVLTQDFVSHDLRLSAFNLRKERDPGKRTDVIDTIDTEENCCDIYEIKHSEKAIPNQYRHLIDEQKCRQAERRFGNIRGRYVLYRGGDAETEAGVTYRNVENYLKALSKSVSVILSKIEKKNKGDYDEKELDIIKNIAFYYL